jgi:hypothetical protein
MTGEPIQFESKYTILPGVLSHRDVIAIKNEPMFYRADVKYAVEHGGPITQEFINLLPSDWKNTNLLIDSRSHMLMPGWYPCIPGWHLDDVPRTRPDGQPDHLNPAYRAEHIMAVIGDCSLTSFLVGRVVMYDVPNGEGVVYKIWNNRINKYLEYVPRAEKQIPPNRLIQFNWQSFHKGNPAKTAKWRWFVRATRYSQLPVENEIRKQVQVYLPALEGGW